MRVKHHFLDNNGLIEDMKDSERRRKEMNPWVEEERQIFLEKYLQFPKRFRKIAEYLPNKTTGDVIAFYYLNKRALNLKKKLREHCTQPFPYYFLCSCFDCVMSYFRSGVIAASYIGRTDRVRACAP